jgi:hypothetical protein
MDSPYLWVKDKWYRRLIRWLYWKFLDELYIPSGTKAVYQKDQGRRPARKNQGCIKLRTPMYPTKKRKNFYRKGVQEHHFFEQYGDMVDLVNKD